MERGEGREEGEECTFSSLLLIERISGGREGVLCEGRGSSRPITDVQKWKEESREGGKKR